MFELELTSVDGEVLKVPFILCKFSPDWDNNRIQIGASSPLTIYENYTGKKWIPEIPLENIPELDTRLRKEYKNIKNNFTLQLDYYKHQSLHFATQWVSVEIRFTYNSSYFYSIDLYSYPYSNQSASFFSAIPLYDPYNNIVGAISGQRKTISEITYPVGRDYCKLDETDYYKWINMEYSIAKNIITDNNTYYFNGTRRPPGNTQLHASDNGKISYTNGINAIYMTRGSGSVRQKTQSAWNAVFENITIPSYPNQNPDGDNDNSGQSPSDPPITGDGDTSSDPIPNPPAKPTFDVTNTGFVVIYNPSVTEIRQLAYFMWSGEFVDLIKKMFASPFEAIISLKMLFCPVTAGSAQTVWLGNVETDVTMAKVTDQFTNVDLGTINVNEFFGSFADYAPFTKIQIYLPFIGFKDLNVDEVMNSQLHLRYRVDVYTGACIAYLTVTKTIKSTNLNSILYQFDGNCAMEIPFTSNDNSRYVAAIMNSVASSALSLANTSGYTMPVAGKGFNQKAIPSTFELGSLAPVANGMLDIMSAKPNVQRAGSLSGAVSAMALKQPYLIIHRPIAQMPADYQKYLGIPLNLTRQLANITGYTIVSQVFMSSELATDKEIAMITETLKNGVIL